jgi:hypothetical protein
VEWTSEAWKEATDNIIPNMIFFGAAVSKEETVHLLQKMKVRLKLHSD